ncbi:methyltransferase family protein [Salinarimonas ramus]|uniref:Isoprenylcysteine carboxylmethyltransferase family protein n=1 Tax=Salinarimonas ramus TaxID=690164 RepID=A0A917V6N1_9HYPH|nr:isoprenylcysteine carboxylmethyltransferase family protein [Salinarimonas ramus]GGK46580.1 hypothetical protein GCM10011322_37080 [Salinarimonas ramus]
MSLPHRSAVVAWSTWAVAFLVTAGLEPRLGEDIAALSPRLLPLVIAGLAFIGIVAALQREMGLALEASSFGEPRRLVTSGTFAWSRNPIYLAFLLPLASLATYAPTGAAIGVGLYLAAMTLCVVVPEERALERTFGAEFDAYRARTPRWIGLPRRG